MPALLAFILSLLLPIAWFLSELRGKPPVRILLGFLSIASVVFCTWAVTGLLATINYNAEYGAATSDLIKASLAAIDRGQVDRVAAAWRELGSRYQPTYENRAGYPDLAAEATCQIRGEARP